MQIITNNKARPLQSFYDLPEKVRADFDYLTHDYERFDPRFVQYKGWWYDVADSQFVHQSLGFDQFKGWNGVQSDSFFSGVLFKFINDYDVIVGRYYS